ncbi:hypothetical protein BD413DRAFT_607726 [Trametes elegans]|nr:hypothetical protein BD413DRAFT_607726 [Trametes elegans]
MNDTEKKFAFTFAYNFKPPAGRPPPSRVTDTQDVSASRSSPIDANSTAVKDGGIAELAGQLSLFHFGASRPKSSASVRGTQPNAYDSTISPGSSPSGSDQELDNGGHAAKARPLSRAGTLDGSKAQALSNTQGVAKLTSVPAPASASPLIHKLNFDIQDYLMSWLPTPTLAALMRTCKHFSDVALVPLCRRTTQPLWTPSELMSFYCFLHIETSTIRVPLIQHLRVAAHVLDAPPDDNSRRRYLGENHGYNQLSDLVHQIVHVCRNLRSLHIYHYSHSLDTSLLLHSISRQTALEELLIPITNRINDRRCRALAKLNLRTFGSCGEERTTHLAPVLQSLGALSSVIELHLPQIHNWGAFADASFRQLRRLVIGFPIRTTCTELLDVRKFPSVTQLLIVGRPDHHYMGDHMMAETESLREHHRQYWKQFPNLWPHLHLLSVDEPCVLYRLAVPRIIPCVSILHHAAAGGPDGARYHTTAIADCSPTILEIRMYLGNRHFVTCHHSHGEFDFLKTTGSGRSSTLQWFIVTLDDSLHVFNDTQYHTLHAAIVSNLVETIRDSSVTHLIMKYRVPVPSPSRGLYPQARLQANLDIGCDVATALAQASSNLSWFGILAEGLPIRSWDVVRPSPSPDGTPSSEPIVVRELNADKSSSILADGTISARAQMPVVDRTGRYMSSYTAMLG